MSGFLDLSGSLCTSHLCAATQLAFSAEAASWQIQRYIDALNLSPYWDLSQQQRKMLLFCHAAQMLRKRLDLTFEQWERRGSQTLQLHKFALPIVAAQAELQRRSAQQLPKDCGVNICGPHFKCHSVLMQEKKILNLKI